MFTCLSRVRQNVALVMELFRDFFPITSLSVWLSDPDNSVQTVIRLKILNFTQFNVIWK